MEKISIKAIHEKTGNAVNLYGFPVFAGEALIGFVCGDSDRGFEGYRLTGEKIVTGYYGFRTRKQAFEYANS